MDPRLSDRSRWRRLLVNALAVVLIVGIFGFLGWRLWVDRAVLHDIDWWAHPGLWASHVLLLVALFATLTLGWVRILRLLGGGTGRSSSASMWLVANIGKYIPGKLFLIAGRVELARRLGVRPAVSLSASMLEHVMMLIAAGPFLVWVLLRGFQVGSDTLWVVAAVAVIPAVALVARPFLLVVSVNSLLRVMKQPPLAADIRPGDSARLLVLYFSGWLAYGASGLFLLGALGLGSAVPPVDGAAAFVAAWMLGFLSLVTPGGIGVREGVLVLLLGSAVPAPEAIMVALVARLSWTLVEMAGVVLGVVLTRRPS